MSSEGKPHSQKAGAWLLRAGGSGGAEEFLWGTVCEFHGRGPYQSKAGTQGSGLKARLRPAEGRLTRKGLLGTLTPPQDTMAVCFTGFRGT